MIPPLPRTYSAASKSVNPKHPDLYSLYTLLPILLHPQTLTMAPRVAIVYWSMYGHIKKLADAEKAGIEAAGGKVDVFQIAETLPEEVLTKMVSPRSIPLPPLPLTKPPARPP